MNNLKRISKWLFMLCLSLVVLFGVKTKAKAVTKYNLWVAGTQVTSENCDNLSKALDMKYYNKAPRFDPNTNTLYLYDVSSSVSYFYKKGEESAFIYSEIPLTVVGSNVSFSTEDKHCRAFMSTSTLTLKGDFEIKGGYAAIYGTKEVNIEGANTTLDINSPSYFGIYSDGNIFIDAKSITINNANYGIFSRFKAIFLNPAHYTIKGIYMDHPAISAAKGMLHILFEYYFHEPLYGKVANYDFGTLWGGERATVINQYGNVAREVDMYESPTASAKSCYVVYDFNGHVRDVPLYRKVTKGDLANIPVYNEEEGYTLKGWYTSKECKDDEEFNFNTPINSNLHLYAKWEEYGLYDIWVCGKRITDINKDRLYPGGNCWASYDSEQKVLTLCGYFYDESGVNEIGNVKSLVYSNVPITIVGVKASLYSDDKSTYPIYLNNGDLIIKGNYEIKSYQTAIYCAGNVRVANMTDRATELKVETEGNGIQTKDNLVFAGGIIDINANKYGIYTENGSVTVGADSLSIVGKHDAAIMGGYKKIIDLQGYAVVVEPNPYKNRKTSRSTTKFYTILDDKLNNATKVRIETNVEAFIVSFDMNGQTGDAPRSQRIIQGGYVQYPDDLKEPKGYTLEGWYTDKAGNNKYNFDTPVMSSFTLYAKWRESTIDDHKTDAVERPIHVPARVGSEWIFERDWNLRVTEVKGRGPRVNIVRFGNKKATKVTVPNEVTIDGVVYEVTGIGSKAFNGCKKLKSVTLGSNIETIENNAFKGAKNLKSIKIRSSSLTKNTVSKKAFSGLSENVKISVPKKMKKSYSKLFTKRGLSKKATIK